MKNLFTKVKKFLSLENGYKGGIVALALVLMFTVGMSGCTNSQIESDLQKVEALLPTVTGIAGSVAGVLAVVDPGIAIPINAAMAIVTASSNTVEAILKQYGTNLQSAPSTIIAQLDAAVAAIQTQLGVLTTIPGIPPIAAAVVDIAVNAVQAILGYLASIIPASLAATLFPRAFAACSSHVQFGVAGVVIPSARDFVQSYNNQLHQKGLDKVRHAKVHAPWVRVFGMPVAP